MNLNRIFCLLSLFFFCSCGTLNAQGGRVKLKDVLIKGTCMITDEYLSKIYTDPKLAREWTKESLLFLGETDKRLLGGETLTPEEWERRIKIYEILGRLPKCLKK